MNLTPENQALWDAAEKAKGNTELDSWNYHCLCGPARIQTILSELSNARRQTNTMRDEANRHALARLSAEQRAEAAEAQVEALVKELSEARAARDQYKAVIECAPYADAIRRIIETERANDELFDRAESAEAHVKVLLAELSEVRAERDYDRETMLLQDEGGMKMLRSNAELRERAEKADARAEAAEAQVKAHLEELERLRATVAKIASQSIGDEIGDEEARSNADYELAYEECVRAARSIRTAKERQAAVTPDEDDIANLEFARDTLRLFIGTHASKMVTLKSAASTAAWRLTATLEHLRKPQGGK